MNELPENFEPLFVAGEADGILNIYTKLSNQKAYNLLQYVLETLEEDGFDEEVVTLQ